MYRDIPLGNRLLANKYINRIQTKHAKALEKIERRKKGSGTLDNKLPDTKKMRHLARNFKKEQMTEDRNVEIERQNGQLLAKMTHIMTNPGMSADFQKAQPSRGDAVPGRSLNVEARRRELVRISKSNEQMLQRILERKPEYNHRQWDASIAEHRMHLRRLRRVFPLQQTPKGVTAHKFIACPDSDEGINALQDRLAKRDARRRRQRRKLAGKGGGEGEGEGEGGGGDAASSQAGAVAAQSGAAAQDVLEVGLRTTLRVLSEWGEPVEEARARLTMVREPDGALVISADREAAGEPLGALRLSAEELATVMGSAQAAEGVHLQSTRLALVDKLEVREVDGALRLVLPAAAPALLARHGKKCLVEGAAEARSKVQAYVLLSVWHYSSDLLRIQADETTGTSHELTISLVEARGAQVLDDEAAASGDDVDLGRLALALLDRVGFIEQDGLLSLTITA